MYAACASSWRWKGLRMSDEKVYDCIIVGAGPGGLQAAIYLARFSKDVLLIDRSGGRTRHAKHIENYLGHKVISGGELVETGIEQARSFNVKIQTGEVSKVLKRKFFEVSVGPSVYHSLFTIISTGVYDNFPPIENVHKYLGNGFYTCVYCDGYRTRGKKLLIIGNSTETANLALAMKSMYTKDIVLLLYFHTLPPDYEERLREENIQVVVEKPLRIIGGDTIEAVELKDGRKIPCEAIMSNLGFKLNDALLSELNLKKDHADFKYATGQHYESSLSGLYIVGPLNTGNDQAVIAAGEGAVAAIDINKRLLERLQ